MKENIKSIKNLPDYEKSVYDFDKKGKRFEKKVKVTDNYLVTLKDGSSVCLTKDQLTFYGVNCVLPNNEEVVSSLPDVNDELENEIDNTNYTQNVILSEEVSSPNVLKVL